MSGQGVTTKRPAVLLVEWGGVTWPDLLPRVQAGHLPALRIVAAMGVASNFPACREDEWPLDQSIKWLVDAGVGVLAVESATLPDGARVAGDELDPSLCRQFPDDAAARPGLTAALCVLYALHNETVARSAEPEVQLVVARHDFVARVDAAYAHSALLPQARRAAFQVLDVLLADLRHQVGGRAAVVVCSPGLPGRRGFCLHGLLGTPTATLPRLPSAAAMPALLAELLGLEVAAGSPLAGALPLNAAWIQPHIVPAGRYAATPVATGDFITREMVEWDQGQVVAIFPRIPWESTARCYAAVSSRQGEVLAAAGMRGEGGVLLAARANQEKAAAAVLACLLADTMVAAMEHLYNASEVPADSLEGRVLQEAGFVVTHTLDLWLAEVAVLRGRARNLAGVKDECWQLRPATAADVAIWRTRPEAAGLLQGEVDFDPDLSWAAEFAGRPAGLLLAARLPNALAVVKLLVTAEEARAAGGFARLINQGRASGESAGIAQLVFSTEETRREVVAFARRCRSRLLRKTLRLHRVRE